MGPLGSGAVHESSLVAKAIDSCCTTAAAGGFMTILEFIKDQLIQGRAVQKQEIVNRYQVDNMIAFDAMKKAEKQGLGIVKVGRRGAPTRIEPKSSTSVINDHDASSAPSVGVASVLSDTMLHTLPLRDGADAMLRVPRAFTAEDAERICKWVVTLPL
jgi:hypothetical protein